MSIPQDKKFMQICFQAAAQGAGRTHPNPLVGALVVSSGRIVGKGAHRRAGGPHAEAAALKQAGAKARGGTLYVSLEPCAHQGRTGPCVEAIEKAGIRRLVAAMQDPNPKNNGKGFRALRRAGIQVRTGVLKREAQELNPVFLTWIKKKRPFLTVKAAQSLNGKIASANGKTEQISGPQARRWAHQLRSEVDGILVGVRTVLKDDPQLTVRLGSKGQAGSSRPLRIILDSQLRTPLTARLFKSPGPILIATRSTASKKKELLLRRAGAELIRLPASGDGVALKPLLRQLARREVSHLLIEGGGEVIASALKTGWVDRVAVVVAPKIIGGRNAPAVVGGRKKTGSLLGHPALKDLRFRKLGRDLLVEANL